MGLVADLTPCDWCEVRFLVMSGIALVGIWHIYLVRVPKQWRRWEEEAFGRVRTYLTKGKRKKR